MVAKSDKQGHPPYAVMVLAAVKFLKNRKGSSKKAILDHVMANNPGVLVSNANVQVKAAIKRLQAKGDLAQASGVGLNGRFKLNTAAVDQAAKAKKANQQTAKKVVAKKTTQAKKKPAVAPKKKLVKPSPKKTTKKQAKSPAKKKAAAKSAKKSTKSPAKKQSVKKTTTKKSPAKKSPTKKPTKKKPAKKTKK